jgi:cell fate (sporulation/competence/biofilm development) regulator YlbF (YheA/YmcA/DUF963 family)
MELGGIIVQKTIELATAFIDSPEYQALQESQRQMENEPEAQRIIQEFQRRQQSLSMLQQMGGRVGVGEVQALRLLQQRMLQQPTVKRYLQCQQELTNYLQTISDILSRKTGLNFTSKGGCC